VRSVSEIPDGESKELHRRDDGVFVGAEDEVSLMCVSVLFCCKAEESCWETGIDILSILRLNAPNSALGSWMASFRTVALRRCPSSGARVLPSVDLRTPFFCFSIRFRGVANGTEAIEIDCVRRIDGGVDVLFGF
jgi:hypothetical protein